MSPEFKAGISYLTLDPCKDGRRFRVVDAVTYVHGDFKHTVPAGYTTDFASIPSTRFFAIMALAVCWVALLLLGTDVAELIAKALFILFALAGRLGAWGKYGWAAILHDHLYSHDAPPWCDRKQADRAFLIFMKLRDTPLITSLFIYCAVRAFGWMFYKGKKKC